MNKKTHAIFGALLSLSLSVQSCFSSAATDHNETPPSNTLIFFKDSKGLVVPGNRQGGTIQVCVNGEYNSLSMGYNLSSPEQTDTFYLEKVFQKSEDGPVFTSAVLTNAPNLP